MSGVGTAIAIGTVAAAGIGAGTAIYSANKQSDAAKQAATVQETDQQQALDFQKQQWATQQKQQAPFLRAGTGAVNTLSNLTKTPGQGLLAPYTQTFTPPTPGQVQSEPGYEFTQQQGLDAINKAASATGNVFSGNTLTAASQFNTGLADTYYNNAYNRALQTFGTNYNVWTNNQANEYNRLANLAGFGQTTAGQLGQEGQAASSNVGNIDITSGANVGRELNNAAAAEASGYVGAGNAITGGVNNLSQYAMLNNILNPPQPLNLNQDWLNVPQTPYTPADLGIPS
jgi:uncharacterized protein with NAD-binding domain and iron-sulfur cluster